MAAPAIASYLHTPHILTLKLREEVEGGGCLFGGQPVPRLHEWIISKHGDLPLIHCNSIIMPSTVGFVRLVLLAVAGVIVANTIVLVVRDVLCDVSMVGLTKRKRD